MGRRMSHGPKRLIAALFLSGSFTVNGDQMTGIVNGIMPANVTLRRQR